MRRKRGEEKVEGDKRGGEEDRKRCKGKTKDNRRRAKEQAYK